MKRSKGFTLIELLAVIVILAIIALIATPMVLKYIEKAREGSDEVSAYTILRAAENYYASTLLNKNGELPVDVIFPDDENKLGIKGKQPSSGKLTINADGTISLDIVYDGVNYSKQDNETSISKNNMVIGDATTWKTDGKGTITRYNDDSLAVIVAQVELQINMFASYLEITLNYAMGTPSYNFSIDSSKTLSENIETFEEQGLVDRSGLPLVLNKELDEVISLYNNQKNMSLEAVMNLLEQNASKLPNIIDFATVTENGTNSSKISSTTAYKVISDAISTSNKIVVPNYVKKANGSLEKITAVGEQAFFYSSNNVISCVIMPAAYTSKGADVVISSGIETIGRSAFNLCIINSVSLPNSLKTIDSYAFAGNRIRSLTLPTSLETINNNAFATAGIRGNLVIPSGVTEIGKNAFADGKCNPAGDDDAYNSCMTLDAYNDITSITIEGDATRFNANWTDIGFPENLKPSA